MIGKNIFFGGHKMCIKRNVTIILMTLLFVMLTACSANKPLLKYIGIENNELIIKLDNTNRKKGIGEILAIDFIQRIYIRNYERNNEEVIIHEDISYLLDKLQENTEYKIVIEWFGGYLRVNTLYENGEFKVLDEDYSAY